MTEKVWAIGARITLALFGMVAVRAAAEPSRLPMLEKAIREKRALVPEFRFLAEQARRLGVRVWLFGGSAAAFSHYVLRDLEGGTGDRAAASGKFSYRYARIFRHTQDADLVVDGPEAAAKALEAKLAAHFPHLLGNKKSAWEVRLLRQDLGDKEAPLTNPNFRGQYTDSHSTGMVEITEPADGESVVRDVRDWGPGSGRFLEDVLARELHFYDSPDHGKTKRAAEGLNPPIFAVVRYFTKAFQYGLAMRPEDEPIVRRLIESFDPAKDLATPYAMRWLEHHGRKLFWHANEVERAWETLERVGLRKALMRGNGPHAVGSLAWWLAKEPLRSHTVGRFDGPADPRRAMAGERAPGQTAAQLGIGLVAHDTSDFLVYEILVSSWDGHPNAFISRQNVDGESAAAGAALYARLGRIGGKFTNMTVHMRLDPNAREGVDFVLDGTPHEGAQIRILNRRAVTVCRELLDWDPAAYLELVSKAPAVPEGEAGVRERIRLEVRQAIEAMPPRELRRFVERTTRSLDGESVAPAYVAEVASLLGRHLDRNTRHALLVRARTNLGLAEVLLRDVWGRLRAADVGADELDGLASLLRVHGASIFAAVADMLASEGWSEPKLWKVAYALVLRAAEREPSEALVRQMWLREPWVEKEEALPRLVEALEIAEAVTAETIAHIGDHSEWASRPEARLLFRALAERTTRSSAEMFRIVMDSQAWSHLGLETMRADVTRKLAWAEFDQGILRLDRAWHDPIFQEELHERWEEWRRSTSLEDRRSYRTFVQHGLAHPGLRARAEYGQWVDGVLKDAADGKLDAFTRSAILARFFADPLVADVPGMDRRFLGFLRAHLQQRRELFSLSAMAEAVNRAGWFERGVAPGVAAFLADALERFPSLLRGENGAAGRAQVTLWLRGPARRIPESEAERNHWIRVARAVAAATPVASEASCAEAVAAAP